MQAVASNASISISDGTFCSMTKNPHKRTAWAVACWHFPITDSQLKSIAAPRFIFGSISEVVAS